MKRLWLFLIMFVLILAASNAHAEVQYLGDVCIKVTGNHLGQHLRLEVLDYGTKIFPIHGLLNNSIPLHGTASLQDQLVMFTLDGSYGALYTTTYTIELNILTLRGSFTVQGIKVTQILPEAFGDGGTAELEVCP